MYKNQLQELAQRSCFNLPAYSWIREGPDHAPQFKATVNFNGEIFESPTFWSTLRQAEHAAAEAALNILSKKGPSKVLASRILDETGVYKNLLQGTAHRAGLKLPVYTTVQSGPGHVPVFSCKVNLAGMSFAGEPAKTKKQAQKNAALTAWSVLREQAKSISSSSSFLSEYGTNDEQEQGIIARYLTTLKPPEMNNSKQRERRTVRSSAPMRRDVIPYGNTKSFYSLQRQNWQCSQLYPELSLYQTCPQERVSQQWDNVSALSSPPRPQFFPFIQSMFQPDHRHYFPAHGRKLVALIPEIGPFLYFSNCVMPFPARSVSQVAIQEIEENSQMEEEWLQGHGDPDSRKNNYPSNVPRLSLNSHSEQRMQERLEEKDEEKSSSSVSKAGNSIQLQCNQLEQCCWISPGFIDARYRPRAINTDRAKFCLQNPDRLDCKQSNIRSQTPPSVSSLGSGRGYLPASFTAPVTIRAFTTASTASLRPESSHHTLRAPPPTMLAASGCSSRPWPEGRKNQGGIPPRHFMAPAVHIRSVVAVCSAPPTKKFPGPGGAGLLSGIEMKNPEDPIGNTSATSSHFSKLRI